MHLACLAAACLLVAGQPYTPKWFGDRATEAEEYAKNGNEKAATDLIKEMGNRAMKLRLDEFKEEMELFVKWKKGVCEFWLGDLSQSIKTLEEIETKEKNRFFRHFLYVDLGDAYLDSGRTKKADPCFQNGLALAATSKKKFDAAELLRIQLMQVRCKLNLGNIVDAKDRLAALENVVFETTKKIEKATKEQAAELQAQWQILRAVFPTPTSWQLVATICCGLPASIDFSWILAASRQRKQPQRRRELLSPPVGHAPGSSIRDVSMDANP